MPRRLLAPLLALSVLLVAAADASAVRTIRTDGDGWITRIGSLATRGATQSSQPTVTRAIGVFGRPTEMEPDGNTTCRIAWSRLRLRALFVSFGGGRACEGSVGLLQTATIRSRKFRTARGLRVGDASSTIRDKHPNARFRRNVWWIASALSPYGEEGTRIPTIEAIVSGGKVRVLRLWVGAAGD